MNNSEYFIINTNTKNTIVGYVYNPPDNDLTIFNEYIDTLLKKIKRKHILIYSV